MRPEDIVRGQNEAVLGCIGLWNSIEQSIWKKVKSPYESDAGGPVQRRRELEDGQFEFMWGIDLLSLRSMRPIAQIALDMEQVRIAEILEISKPFQARYTIGLGGSLRLLRLQSFGESPGRD